MTSFYRISPQGAMSHCCCVVWGIPMMIETYENPFRITHPLWGESACQQGYPHIEWIMWPFDVVLFVNVKQSYPRLVGGIPVYPQGDVTLMFPSIIRIDNWAADRVTTHSCQYTRDGSEPEIRNHPTICRHRGGIGTERLAPYMFWHLWHVCTVAM